MAEKRTFKDVARHIIFDSNTVPSKLFDLALIGAITLSVLVVMLDSVEPFHRAYGMAFVMLEWGFTLIFTIEYLLRLYVASSRLRYARSFFGIIDLLAILPTYFSVFVPGAQYFLVMRFFRVLRIFRLLKLVTFVREADFVTASIRASGRKIMVFLFFVLVMVCIVGSVMYMIEGPENGFRSIPESIYWAIVTVTTVGYGDISPQTVSGRMLASLLMIVGYSIIAVPTGIVSAEMTSMQNRRAQKHFCPTCPLAVHDDDALYCRYCGGLLVNKRNVQ
ncbi:MAG: ion transporter [Chlorobium sp.]|uniref:ion transporter n=1 Tax=Chlorobium sp. TaxID=1095 RepID=UPI0025C54E16|nr:ion transporter [Chlorobium sp.]MCF8217092.1 ion transporter [Chlorobium sp.]